MARGITLHEIHKGLLWYPPFFDTELSSRQLARPKHLPDGIGMKLKDLSRLLNG